MSIPLLSPNFNYYFSRLLKDPDRRGATCLAGQRAAKCKGYCLEKTWPSDVICIPEKKIKEAEIEARNYRTAFYQRCLNHEDIKFSLLREHGVQISIKTFDSFREAGYNGIVPLPSDNDARMENHCVALCGYNDLQPYTFRNGKAALGFYTFANSWGEAWGNNGYGYLPYDYVNKYAIEIFTSGIIFDVLFNKDSKVYIDEVEGGEDTLFLCSWSSTGFTLTHYNILGLDLYDNSGNLLGWLLSSPRNNFVSEVIDFFVWPDYRYNGYGDFILKEYLSIEKKRGVNFVFGYMSMDDAEQDGWKPVTHFFTKRGFKDVRWVIDFPWAAGILYKEL